jgi:hypothetical protein
MAKLAHEHDVFTCPHSGKDWHKKAVRLHAEMWATESGGIREIIKKDLGKTLKNGLEGTWGKR